MTDQSRAQATATSGERTDRETPDSNELGGATVGEPEVAAPTGYMGADFCNIQPGDTVAVWAERVIAIDRFPEPHPRETGPSRRLIDKFPMGVIMNKGMTVRTAQQHGQAYMDRLLAHAQKGELNPAYLATHRFSLEDAPRGYDMFKHKTDGCVRAVFAP
jgi:hypothetical protein